MNANPPDVIHFTCQSCGMALTVPIQMAGVSGPCPGCGSTITSPHAAPREPSFMQQPTAPVVPPPAPISPSLEAMLQGTAPAALPPQMQQTPLQQPVMPPSPQALLGQLPGAAGAAWPPAPVAPPVSSILGGMNLPPGMQGLPGRPGMPQAPQMNIGTTGIGHHPANTPVLAPAPVSMSNAGPPRRERQSSGGGSSKLGAFLLGTLMVVLALAGTAWFFQDPLKAAWRSYTLKNQEEENIEPGTTLNPSIEEVRKVMEAHQANGDGGDTSSTTPAGDAASAEKPVPKATPVNQPPAAPDASNKEEAPKPRENEDSVVIKPADIASAVVDDSMTPGSLVEVPAEQAATVPAAAAATPKLPVIYEEATPETKPAVDVLRKFFEAKSWQERAQYVQWPDQMSQLMEQYYKSNPDGAINVAHIQLIPRNKEGHTDEHPHCVFQVAGGEFKHPMPVMVEETEQGWKVDWLTFIEFKDELLKKFSENYVDDAARFHVMVRRTHYFDDDVPQMDKKICYEMQPPVPGFKSYAFATKGTPFAQELDRNLGWDVASAAVVVELQWKRQDNYQWLELSAIPQYNWRTPDPLPASEQPASKGTKK